MRDGYKVIDLDTHVVPHLETLQKICGPQL